MGTLAAHVFLQDCSLATQLNPVSRLEWSPCTSKKVSCTWWYSWNCWCNQFLCRLRTSSHHLGIEQGRYIIPKTSAESRVRTQYNLNQVKNDYTCNYLSTAFCSKDCAISSCLYVCGKICWLVWTDFTTLFSSQNGEVLFALATHNLCPDPIYTESQNPDTKTTKCRKRPPYSLTGHPSRPQNWPFSQHSHVCTWQCCTLQCSATHPVFSPVRNVTSLFFCCEQWAKIC